MPSSFDFKLNVKGKYHFLVTDDTQILATQTVRTASIRTVLRGKLLQDWQGWREQVGKQHESNIYKGKGIIF